MGNISTLIYVLENLEKNVDELIYINEILEHENRFLKNFFEVIDHSIQKVRPEVVEKILKISDTV